jgi:hypothetical protein
MPGAGQVVAAGDAAGVLGDVAGVLVPGDGVLPPGAGVLAAGVDAAGAPGRLAGLVPHPARAASPAVRASKPTLTSVIKMGRRFMMGLLILGLTPPTMRRRVNRRLTAASPFVHIADRPERQGQPEHRPAPHPVLVSEDDFITAQEVNASRGPVP